jgi:hypothetical protein
LLSAIASITSQLKVVLDVLSGVTCVRRAENRDEVGDRSNERTRGHQINAARAGLSAAACTDASKLIRRGNVTVKKIGATTILP